MKKVPKRRFKGFLNAGDWEQRKLGDVVKRESVTQVSSTEYPAIEYEDVIPETGQLNKDIYKKGVQKAGILFDANKVLYGKLRPYLHNWVAPMYKGVAVGDWWVLNPCGLDRGFLYTLIQTVKFDTIANQSTGSKMPRADWKLLSTTEFSIPSLDEQIKIGKLVEGLNDYITLHQRKLEKLQATKKALLYELFPIENSRRPKLRFKGFTGDWEQRKLGELLEQPITDGPHETPELYDSGIPFISVDAIIDNKIDFTKMRGCISKEYDDICAKKYKPQINDVYLVKSGATIGKVAIVDTYDDFNIWSPLAAMRCGSITNPYFLYVLLQTKDLQTQVFNKASHGTQPNLSMRQLETFACKVPKIEEQILISRFFKRLNDSITLHQRKLEKLKNLKAAYLNEMFV